MPAKQNDPLPTVAAFFEKVAQSKETVYVAIDPGAEGAIAFLCGRACAVVDIPVTVLKTKRTKSTTAKERKKTGHKTKTVEGRTTKFDLGGICEIFKLIRPHKDRVTVVLEDVPTSLGPGKRHAEIMLNRAYAMWPLFLYSRNYRVEEVRPGVWKQRMGLAGKEKEASRLKALALFPRADILLKKHHDRAEALLMAEFVRRMHTGAL